MYEYSETTPKTRSCNCCEWGYFTYCCKPYGKYGLTFVFNTFVHTKSDNTFVHTKSDNTFVHTKSDNTFVHTKSDNTFVHTKSYNTFVHTKSDRLSLIFLKMERE